MQIASTVSATPQRQGAEKAKHKTTPGELLAVTAGAMVLPAVANTFNDVVLTSVDSAVRSQSTELLGTFSLGASLGMMAGGALGNTVAADFLGEDATFKGALAGGAVGIGAAVALHVCGIA